MKLLTFNVQMFPVPFRRNRSRAKKLQFLLAPAKYDIICLQELYHSSYPFPNCVNRNALFPNMYAALVPKPRSLRFTCDAGLAIYSKRQILISKFCPFSKSGHLNDNGVLYACIRVSEHRHVHVFNTHLHKKSRTIRAVQLEELYIFINSITSLDTAAIILTGDFNQRLIDIPMFRSRSIYSGHQTTGCFNYVCVQDSGRLAGNISTHSLENISTQHAVEFEVR